MYPRAKSNGYNLEKKDILLSKSIFNHHRSRLISTIWSSSYDKRLEKAFDIGSKRDFTPSSWSRGWHNFRRHRRERYWFLEEQSTRRDSLRCVHPTVRPDQPARCSPTGDDEFTVKDAWATPPAFLSRNPRFHPPPTGNPREPLHATVNNSILLPPPRRLENTSFTCVHIFIYLWRDIETKNEFSK